MVPVTVSKYVPGVALGATVNPLPDNWPDAVIVHVAEATITGLDGDWPKVHVPTSPELNPPPVTAIWAPIAAAFGVGTMNGALVVTVKVLEAESPLRPGYCNSVRAWSGSGCNAESARRHISAGIDGTC